MSNPRKSLRLGMMHYHLKPGGVTSVMRDISVALREYSDYESVQIDVFSSAPARDNARRIFGWKKNGDASRLRIEEIPSLAYNRARYSDRSSFLKAADRLALDILERIHPEADAPDCPYILHSHNISLGKNPTATMAFKRIAEIAAERSLPLWLINHVHDFAENNRPDGIEAFFTCTGRRDESFALSFMYPFSRNIVYVVINSADTQNLATLGVPPERIFVLPDPIDVLKYEQSPLWEVEQQEIRALGLSAADYRTILFRRISEYAESKKQRFEDSLPILLSPVKIMRRKNSIEALLLLMLFGQLGRSYQLLITLGPNSPPDAAFSRTFKDAVLLLNLPVVTGFGRELISATGERRISNDSVKQFSLCDLYGLCTAILTTSIVEGFGLAYHEGWLSERIVIGRIIQDVVRDFVETGMRFDHMYDRLAVSLTELPNLRQRLLDAYEEKVRSLRAMRSRNRSVSALSSSAILEGKIFRAGGSDCVDFADLSTEMQTELLDTLQRNPAVAKTLIDRNPQVIGTFNLLEGSISEPERTNLLRTNQEAIRRNYSLQAAARRLGNIFEVGDSLYKKACKQAAPTPATHARMSQRYRTSENLRLLF